MMKPVTKKEIIEALEMSSVNGCHARLVHQIETYGIAPPEQHKPDNSPPCPVWLVNKDVSHAWAAGWSAAMSYVYDPK